MADFITNITKTTDVNDSVFTEMDQQFLIAAAPNGITDQFVTYKREINAKAIDFPKYSQLALATTALTEGEEVSRVKLVDSKVTITPVEYGNVVTTTSLANIQSGGKADLAAARLAGINMSRTLDKLAINAAEASTNVLTPAGGAVTAIVAGDVMTTTFLNKLYNKLSRAGVQPLADGMYVAQMHADVIHDLRNSTGAGSWQDISKYSKPDTVLMNEIGNLCGFRIIENSQGSIEADGGAAAVDVYRPIFMGFNALGKAVSKNPGLIMTPGYDALSRFANVGWHGILKYEIVDQDSLWVGACASSLGANT
jgi:N4-gp56 family major capsid protein